MLSEAMINLRQVNLLKNKFPGIKLLWLVIFSLSSLPLSALAEEINRGQIKGLDEQVQDIKKDVLALTSELSLLEEKLLFPSNTQVSLFVSLKGDKDFVLDSMQIKLDNKVVAQHLYTYKEIEALNAGGVQRIYTGNIKTGDHNLVASFIGRGSSGTEYQRNGNYTVNKAVGPRFVEIQITGSSASDQTVSFKDW
ncbi:MAG: hypothetical protein LJE83_15600 [Gammaproteobacteria bacterium]|jgi:hypothetical protein|nr:hypothetical protein [Gammaproteobacteria bacterium]